MALSPHRKVILSEEQAGLPNNGSASNIQKRCVDVKIFDSVPMGPGTVRVHGCTSFNRSDHSGHSE